MKYHIGERTVQVDEGAEARYKAALEELFILCVGDPQYSEIFEIVDKGLDHFVEANNGIDHREGDFEKFFGCAPGLTGGLTAREYIDSVRGEDADHSADASKMIAVNGSQMAIDSDPITAQCWCGEYLTADIADEGTGCYVCPVHGCYWMKEDEPKMGSHEPKMGT